MFSLIYNTINHNACLSEKMSGLWSGIC